MMQIWNIFQIQEDSIDTVFEEVSDSEPGLMKVLRKAGDARRTPAKTLLSSTFATEKKN